MAGETKSLMWSAISGVVLGLVVEIALHLYTPFFSFRTDLMGELGAVILGVVPSEITTLIVGRVPWDK